MLIYYPFNITSLLFISFHFKNGRTDRTSLEDSTIWKAKNKEGHTALTLLVSYYREHDEKFGSFLMRAAEEIDDRPYLMDMVPAILPACKSPNRLMNNLKDPLIATLRKHYSFDADLQLLGALVNVSSALRISANVHPVEGRDLCTLLEDFETALAECMNSNSMDYPENVTLALRRRLDEDTNAPEIVLQAYSFLYGPLHDCVAYDMTRILSSRQIINYVNNVFYGSLKTYRPSVIRGLSDAFQLRSGCSAYRYCPVIMFTLEGVSKLIFTFAVSIVCVSMSEEACQADNQDPSISCHHVHYWEITVYFLFVTSLMYEIGEIFNKCKLSVDQDFYTTISNVSNALSVHFADRWNLLDILTIIFISAWVYLTVFITRDRENDDGAQAWLTLSAISLSLGLLRFQSLVKQTGQLVIMIFEMINDLGAFLLVFMTCILGFGIAFHSLFPTLDGFQSASATFLTLFDAALGNHDFSLFAAESAHETIGIVLMMVYTILVMIVLLNLIIARMSATHEKIDSSALEVWSRVQAINVEQFVLLFERNPMSMLPPPLNIISVSAWIVNSMFSVKKIFKSKKFEPNKVPKDDIVNSIAGTTSDIVTT